MIRQLLRPNRDRLRLPRASYSAVMDNRPLTLLEPVDRPGGLTLEELAIIVGVCQRAEPCRVFEIGSFRGRTSINILQNCPEARVTTLDLPPDHADDEALAFPLGRGDRIVADEGFRGTHFENYPQFADRVTRLFGDSATFDFSPYHGAFDVVFIDGSHRYENVLADSETALRLLDGGRGVVLWHDYAPEQPGSVRAIHEIADRHGLDIRWIKRTKFAYLAMEGTPA